MWEGGWDSTDADWRAYEACQATCHAGAACAQPAECSAPAGAAVSGVELVDSGILTHQPFNTQECTWTLQCSNTTLQVLLTFTAFDLESGYDYLHMHNGLPPAAASDPCAAASANMATCQAAGNCWFTDGSWTGGVNSCGAWGGATSGLVHPDVRLHGAYLPDPWLSNTYTATAQYSSDSSVDGAGFTATFTCVDGSTIPPPPPHPCHSGGIMLVDTGDISHSALQPAQECIWNMTCSNFALSPQVTFTAFDTEQGFDFLYLYDGIDTPNPTATFHGRDRPADWTALSGYTAMARYTSDTSIDRAGFAATFTCIDATNIPPPPPDPCSTVGLTLTDHGEVYHGQLENNQACTWHLSCSNAAHAATVVFATFDIEHGWDFLYMYDAANTMGGPAATLHGSSVPPTWKSSGPNAVLQYVSDWSIQGAGFTALFSCVDPASVPPPPPDPCTTGGIALIDAGSIFHGNLDNNQACTWSMTCSDPTHVPQVSFLAFDVETRFDFLNLFDGNSVTNSRLTPTVTLHGSEIPDAFTGTGTVATAVYTSDGSIQGNGFTAAFACVLPGTAPPAPAPAPPGSGGPDNLCDVCTQDCDAAMNWFDPTDADWVRYTTCTDGCWGITGVCQTFYRDPCETCIAGCQDLVSDWDSASVLEIAAYETCEGGCFAAGHACEGWTVNACDECFWACEANVDFSDPNTDWTTIGTCQDGCYETGNACHDPCQSCLGQCWEGVGSSLIQQGACVAQAECGGQTPGGVGSEPAGCVWVNHVGDNPGQLTCDCVDPADPCRSSWQDEPVYCPDEPACDPANG